MPNGLQFYFFLAFPIKLPVCDVITVAVANQLDKFCWAMRIRIKTSAISRMVKIIFTTILVIVKALGGISDIIAISILGIV